MNVAFNDYLKGLKVEEPPGQYVWKFSPVKEGETKLTVYFSHKGSPIGEPTNFNLKISQSPITSLGNIMRLRLFPPEEQIVIGSPVAIQVEDNLTGTVLGDVSLYLNGIKMEANTFTAEQGKLYSITASKEGFLALEKVLVLQKVLIIVKFEGEVEEGSAFNIITNPENTTLKINGQAYENPISLAVGTHKLEIDFPGYEKYATDLVVTPPLVITSEVPNKISIGKEASVGFNKDVAWDVQYQEKNESSPVVIASATSQTLTFTPNKKGLYTLNVRGSPIKIYDTSSAGMAKYLKIAGILAGAVALFIIARKLFSSKSSSEDTEGSYAFSQE